MTEIQYQPRMYCSLPWEPIRYFRLDWEGENMKFDDYETGIFEPTDAQLRHANIEQIPDKPWWKFWAKQNCVVFRYERVGNILTVWGRNRMWTGKVDELFMSPWN